MMDTKRQSDSEYASVLERVSHWSSSERLALVQDILRTLSTSLNESRQEKDTWKQASGLLAGPWPTPTDADVERWLEERREEKFG